MVAAQNLCRQPGAEPFASSSYPADIHNVRNINDGKYGNSNSWIPHPGVPTSPMAFVGVHFGGRESRVQTIALGRDNEGKFGDRIAGRYIVQYTRSATAGAETPDA